MAIKNRWKEVIALAGISQNTFADAIGKNRGEFSRVCNGIMILDTDEFEKAMTFALDEYGVDIREAYPSAIFRHIYGQDFLKERMKPAAVRIPAEIADKIDFCVSRGEYKSRNAATEIILRRHFENEQREHRA